MSHKLDDVSTQHNARIPFGDMLLLQKMQYLYWNSQMNLRLNFLSFILIYVSGRVEAASESQK